VREIQPPKSFANPPKPPLSTILRGEIRLGSVRPALTRSSGVRICTFVLVKQVNWVPGAGGAAPQASVFVIWYY
jgi:hypothetical protein